MIPACSRASRSPRLRSSGRSQTSRRRSAWSRTRSSSTGLQGEGRAVRARPAGGEARREARLRDGDHAHEGGRGQDDDLGLADAGSRQDRQAAGALPARGLPRPGVRDQGRRGRRRLRPGCAVEDLNLHFTGDIRHRRREQPPVGPVRHTCCTATSSASTRSRSAGGAAWT